MARAGCEEKERQGSVMSEIMNVEYEVQKELADKSTEELQHEVNGLYHQIEMVGNIAMMIAANAGQRLLVIKDRLKHGEFESWCESHLDFSKRKAEMMMSLAKRCEEENSLFSKTQMFADLSVSKVFTLLSAPEEVAVEVIENSDASLMTVRELKEEIAALKLRNDELESESGEIEALKNRIAELEAESSETEVDKEELAAKSEEIENLKLKLQKEKDKLKKSKNDKDEEVKKVLEETRVELDREIEKAVATAKVQAKADRLKIEEELEEAYAEIEKLSTAAASGETLTAFRINVKSLQTIFNECLGQLAELDENTSKKLKKALIEILTSEMEALNEEK